MAAHAPQGSSKEINASHRRQLSEAAEQLGLSLSDAAQALGVTRRMIAYYEAGRDLIPRMVGLACKGWEAEHRHHA